MRNVTAPYLPSLFARGVTAQTPGFAGRVIPVIPTTPILKFSEIYQRQNAPARLSCVRGESSEFGVTGVAGVTRPAFPGVSACHGATKSGIGGGREADHQRLLAGGGGGQEGRRPCWHTKLNWKNGRRPSRRLLNRKVCARKF